MDNKVSENMKNHIKDNCRLTVELVPPGCHQQNAAEVAIRNFKAHFLSILAGVAKDFLPSLWDQLLPQTEITLNLLCQSNTMPTVSPYAHLNGPFDYNKLPLAPMGCEVQVHKKSDSHGTWAYHSVDGWYLSTLPEHYHMHVCHIKSTKSDQLSDTVHFKHKHITNPALTHDDKIMKAVAELSKILKQKPSIIAKHDHEIRNLQQLMDTTGANGAIPTLPRVSEMRTALPRVQQAATLPRVPTDAQGHLNESPATTTPIDARRRLHEPPAMTMPTTHTVHTNAHQQ
jgi:hypothetical protein